MSGAVPQIHVEGRHVIEGVPLFAPLDVTLRAGEWTCVLGRSGVGKTTLLRLIAGMDCEGAFEGHIAAADNRPIHGRASFMAQTDLLLPWLSVLENTVLGARLRGEAPDFGKAERLLARVGLGERMAAKPRALSGGMRQRNALARTLMEDRPIAFLDEPFSALDASTRADMQELAAEMLRGKTVLHVTHDPAEAVRLGHQVIVLTEGGAKGWPLPEAPPLRDPYAPEAAACQAELIAYLRGLA